jgi:hypothetical protein
LTDLLDRLKVVDPAAQVHGWAQSPEGRSVRAGVLVVPRRRRMLVASLAAAAAVVALAGIVAALTHATSSSYEPAAPATQRLVEGTWRVLPRSPLGALGRAQMFSTARGVLVWGEHASAGEAPGFHGAIYQPTTRTWHLIAEPPPPLLNQDGQWTGHDLVFPRAALAYSVERDSWRTIAAAPISLGSSSLYTWTGRVLVAMSPGCDPLDAPTCAGPSQWMAAVYSPANDTWRTLSPPPSGQSWKASAPIANGFLVWGPPPSVSDANATVRFDFARGAWDFLEREPPDSGQSELVSLVKTGTTTAWLGWYHKHGLDGELRAARFRANTWQPLRTRVHPSICEMSAVPGPRGTAVLMCDSTHILLLDVVGDEWFSIPDAPRAIRTLTWTGHDLFAVSPHGRLMSIR